MTGLVVGILTLILSVGIIFLGFWLSCRTPVLEETTEDRKEFEVWRELEKEAPKMGDGFGRWLGAVVARERSERIDAEYQVEQLQRQVTEQGEELFDNERGIQQQADTISDLLDENQILASSTADVQTQINDACDEIVTLKNQRDLAQRQHDSAHADWSIVVERADVLEKEIENLRDRLHAQATLSEAFRDQLDRLNPEPPEGFWHDKIMDTVEIENKGVIQIHRTIRTFRVDNDLPF